jgi:hypothetical protein
VSAYETGYGTYCPTCYQFVPEKRRDAIPEPELNRFELCRFRRAFAEVYGLNPLWVRRCGIRPGISVLAGQVMANDIKEYVRTMNSRKKMGAIRVPSKTESKL